tara:strand:+ start:525 stop:668 length:144 start_codon:yes stop_codon:yes gene_type:complete
MVYILIYTAKQLPEFGKKWEFYVLEGLLGAKKISKLCIPWSKPYWTR